MIEVGFVSSSVAASIVDDELFDRIANSNCQKSDIARSYSDSDIYIAAVDNGVLLGVVTFSPESSTTVEVHCNFIQEHRAKAYEAGKLIMRRFLDTYPTVQKLRASIPETYPDVIGYAMKFGFIKEGIDRKSIAKGGNMIDRIYLGALRDEVEQSLWAQ